MIFNLFLCIWYIPLDLSNYSVLISLEIISLSFYATNWIYVRYTCLPSRDITLPTKVHLVKAMVFPLVLYGCQSWTVKTAERWRIFLNCGAGEESWESLGLQGDPTSPSSRRSVLNIHWKYWCWSWNSSTLATWCEELTHWKRPWCWEKLKAGGKGDNRGCDGWIASLT